MLPIIFGTGPRREHIDDGEFHCPHCQTQRKYERLRVRNYFRLYFIPLIPLGDGRDVVVCQTCGTGFDPVVLTLNAPSKPKNKRTIQPLATQLNALEETLRAGKPIEYVVADLTAAGLDRDLANDSVNRAIGTARAQCSECWLTYAVDVTECSEDGTPLTKR